MDTGGGRPVIDGSRLNYRPDVTITAGNATLQGFSIRNGVIGIMIYEHYDPSISGITVYDNQVSDTCSTAISAEYVNASNITGNMLCRSVRGIAIGTNDNLISGNTIANMSEAGISVAFGCRDLITGNTVLDSPGDGIETYADPLTVSIIILSGIARRASLSTIQAMTSKAAPSAAMTKAFAFKRRTMAGLMAT